MSVTGARLLVAMLGCLCVNASRVAAEPIPLADAIADVQPRLVKLYGAGGLKNLEGYGTGFLVSPDGHIATVWSHVLDASAVTVVQHNGRRSFAQVLGGDSARDVAIVKIDGADLPYFDIQQSASVGPGASVLAFSNMFKVAAGDEPLTVMHGVVAARTQLSARRGRSRLPYQGPVYIVDAVTNNPGAAGGVLTTLDGKLLGMIGREARNEETQTWMNYTVPLDELRPAIEDLIAGRRNRVDPLAAAETSRGSFTPLDFGLVLAPNVVQRTPAYIDAVAPDSAAEKLGLAPDDLIVLANGEVIPSIRSFEDVLRRLAPGDDLQLTVRRGDELVSVSLRAPRPRGTQR